MDDLYTVPARLRLPDGDVVAARRIVPAPLSRSRRDEVVEAVAELYVAGASIREMADLLRVDGQRISYDSVRRLLVGAGATPRGRGSRAAAQLRGVTS